MNPAVAGTMTVTTGLALRGFKNRAPVPGQRLVADGQDAVGVGSPGARPPDRSMDRERGDVAGREERPRGPPMRARFQFRDRIELKRVGARHGPGGIASPLRTFVSYTP